MNFIKRYKLYKKFLSTDPISAVHIDWKNGNFYRVKMEYKIDNMDLTVNAFIDEDEFFGYGANIVNNENKIITNYYNPFFAKRLYEHGQRYL